MNTTFALNQGNDGQLQMAHVKVPGCGRNKKDDGPVVSIEIENGNITLLVYADIQSEEPTHVIPLNGAKVSKKAPVKMVVTKYTPVSDVGKSTA